MAMERSIVWFRETNLRIEDHPALLSAGVGDVIPVFFLDPRLVSPEAARYRPHAAQFLLEALGHLADELAQRGSRLTFVPGRPAEELPRVAVRWAATRVVAVRGTSPVARAEDSGVARALDAATSRAALELIDGDTLCPPGTLRSGSGKPYAVFTPFSKSFASTWATTPPRPAPERLPSVPAAVETARLPDLQQLGVTPNAALLPAGERAAHERLAAFVLAGAA